MWSGETKKSISEQRDQLAEQNENRDIILRSIFPSSSFLKKAVRLPPPTVIQSWYLDVRTREASTALCKHTFTLRLASALVLLFAMSNAKK